MDTKKKAQIEAIRADVREAGEMSMQQLYSLVALFGLDLQTSEIDAEKYTLKDVDREFAVDRAFNVSLENVASVLETYDPDAAARKLAADLDSFTRDIRASHAPDQQMESKSEMEARINALLGREQASPSPDDYCAVFIRGASYYHSSGITPDMHSLPFKTKLEAVVSAREYQSKRKADPSFVVDLTNVSKDELSAAGIL